MEFKCNGAVYKIKEVDNIDLKEEITGQTDYQSKTILLKKLDREFMLRTLKHELTHVWLWEYGHTQDDRIFNCEDVCEIVACSNNFINEVLKRYKELR